MHEYRISERIGSKVFMAKCHRVMHECGVWPSKCSYEVVTTPADLTDEFWVRWVGADDSWHIHKISLGNMTDEELDVLRVKVRMSV